MSAVLGTVLSLLTIALGLALGRTERELAQAERERNMLRDMLFTPSQLHDLDDVAAEFAVDLHEHDWTECAGCPNSGKPCACAGGACPDCPTP